MTTSKTKIKPSDDVVAVPKSALAALAHVLAPLVAEQIAAASVATTDTFTSRSLPPHVSRRAFRERCATIAEARKIGHTWHVSRAAWFASARRAKPIAVPSRDTAQTAAEPNVDAMLEAAGLRATRAA